MVTSDFKPEMEIRPFRACDVKNNAIGLWLLFMAESPKFSRHKENCGCVEKHDGDVRF